ncbi:Bromoperoxidase-catalase [Cytospora mali]|uniref:Bromoperoxidase-catalase n=1 Tax=Cytospora mali TaxID=578113 RepID=A0A194VTP7_CYTMA|nr:Bromoperoxidase-catalase [Valsa mali]
MHHFFGRGTPKSVRHVNGYSRYTYELAKEDRSFVYPKVYFISDQHKVLTNDEVDKLAGEYPKDIVAILHRAIEAGNLPFWKLNLQVMSPEDAEHYRWNIFGMAKVLPHADIH